jgi:hypothetical protein
MKIVKTCRTKITDFANFLFELSFSSTKMNEDSLKRKTSNKSILRTIQGKFFLFFGSDEVFGFFIFLNAGAVTMCSKSLLKNTQISKITSTFL